MTSTKRITTFYSLLFITLFVGGSECVQIYTGKFTFSEFQPIFDLQTRFYSDSVVT